MPKAISAASSSPATHSANRTRSMLKRFIVAFHREAIACATHRMDELHLERIVDLPPQVANIDIDDVRLVVDLVVPDMIGDQRAGEDMVRRSHQAFQDRILFGGQVDQLAAPLNST